MYDITHYTRKLSVGTFLSQANKELAQIDLILK